MEKEGVSLNLLQEDMGLTKAFFYIYILTNFTF